ncbi:universal stress protein [Pseudomonas putida]|jgi:nucleotide-binding universal stress UspA family protein|uniref:Universal stress protein n=1 Tax=Pseudomonas putida TaxID=303 RepID=A0AAW5HF27_PSEPU|nr:MULTISPECIES: universal stress protein [Pseudomonas]EKT4531757.1 universal stress protein [Pseudomonas putida]MCG3646137.1 universal stress protein [Pseudomonas putida]MCO1619451.1 universal stress protein [Pseudomonas putida]MDD2075889.1 universal stress protein [Pseudomonas putida]MDF3173897.1 universal stress protein [Pseudomonas sp. ER28]
MHKILVAVDGSEHSERAVRYLIGLIQEGGLLGGNVEVHLLNVQPLLPTRIANGMSEDERDRYYGDRSAEDSRKAEVLLKQEGIAFTLHSLQGDAASQIVACAHFLGCDSIILGSHGNGFLAGIFLGSVAAKVIQLSDLPITLVK